MTLHGVENFFFVCVCVNTDEEGKALMDTLPPDVWYTILLQTECVLLLRATCRLALELSRTVPLRFVNVSRQTFLLMRNSSVSLHLHSLSEKPASYFLFGFYLNGGVVEERTPFLPVWNVHRACVLAVSDPWLTSLHCRPEIADHYLNFLGRRT